MTLEIGNPAPDFTLPKDGGGEISLSALKGKPVVVYFYPKADTPGCTKEACAFGEAMPDFAKLDATIIGISKDPVKKLDKFKAKYSLPFTLASDEQADVCERYGVWVEKSMYGRTYMGIQRASFLVGPDGNIAAVWPQVKIATHADEVLAALKAL